MFSVHSTRFRSFSLSLVCTLLSLAPAGATTVVLPDGSTLGQVDFERHVMGLLGRTGCNAGACHGSFQGKGGLYLSLFGYSPEKDHQAFTREGMGRRINTVKPDESLILLKATGQIPHGGGQRFAKGSYAYQVIREWIAQGATRTPGSGEIKSVRVTPAEHLFQKSDDTKKLQVLVEFADGTRADMTYFSEFRINDDYVAEINPQGLVKALRPGDTTAVISYRGQVLTARVLIPVPVAKGFVYPKAPEKNFIDREVFAKLRKLNVVPSDLSNDAEFLRRVTIDTIGTLPTPDEVRAFLADKDPAKRAKKIDALLAHPMHAALWATKFSDITGNNVDTIEQPQNLKPKRSKMWHDWLRRRFAENVPYDELVKGILCATSREGDPIEEWVKESLTIDQQAAKSFNTDYPQRASLDLFWRRGNNGQQFTLEQMAEHTAAAFLGVRIECAQCHKHPFDRWTQTDYRAYANIFAQVKVGISPEAKKAIDQANAELRKNSMARNNNQITQVRELYVSNDRLRRLPHPETNASLPPRALGGPDIPLEGDAREALFKWLVQPDNPYFARIFVNRVWAHYFGVGLVEPVDNFSAANPPSNERLLDALAKDFVAHKYDIRHLERTVLNSRTYQLSATPNETNRHDKNSFARSYVRRMMAEVVVDVMNEALGVKETFGNDVPAGVRAIEVAPSRVQNGNLAYAFRIFGRPPRATTCDCERAMEPALPQTLYLMTDQTILSKITSGRLRTLLAEKKADADVVDELFLATVSRFPTAEEKASVLESVASRGRQEGFGDALWALVNTREFILNH